MKVYVNIVAAVFPSTLRHRYQGTEKAFLFSKAQNSSLWGGRDLKGQKNKIMGKMIEFIKLQ